MKTFTSEQKATDFMRMKNRTAVNPSRQLNVMVDGPDDLEFTVMPLKEAIEMGFNYKWEV